MGWLKKIGLVLGKVAAAVIGFDPIIHAIIPQSASPTVGKVEDGLVAIAGIVTTAEGMFVATQGPDAKSGADKLKASVPFVAQLIQQSSIFYGKKIKDSTKFVSAVTQITSSMADLLNSLEYAPGEGIMAQSPPTP